MVGRNTIAMAASKTGATGALKTSWPSGSLGVRSPRRSSSNEDECLSSDPSHETPQKVGAVGALSLEKLASQAEVERRTPTNRTTPSSGNPEPNCPRLIPTSSFPHLSVGRGQTSSPFPLPCG